jgi:hypothetical protein
MRSPKNFQVCSFARRAYLSMCQLLKRRPPPSPWAAGGIFLHLLQASPVAHLDHSVGRDKVQIKFIESLLRPKACATIFSLG